MGNSLHHTGQVQGKASILDFTGPILLGLCLTLFCAASSAALQVLEYRVATGDDDAEEEASGVSLGSSDLELTVDNSFNQTVGIRFNNVAVAKGEQISGAYIQFQVDETSSSVTTLTIQGEKSADAQPFSSTSGDITARLRTGAAVAWSPPPWPTAGVAGIDQRSADISAVIQEIIDQAGWASGNSLVVIVTGDGNGKRTAEAYEGDAAGAPLLHIEYGATPGNTAPAVSAGPDRNMILPVDTLCLEGAASDDGIPGGLGVNWTQQSGPAVALLETPAAPVTTATFPGAGVYKLVIQASDGELSAIDDVLVTTGRRIDVPGDAATIQAAVDMATDGDLVLVAPGTYLENVFVADKNITLASHYYLSGDPADIAATIIDGNGGAAAVDFNSSSGPDSTIIGFTIQNALDGVNTLSLINILDNRIIQTFDAIQYETGSGGVARGNLLELNDDDGVDINRDANILIEKNIIRDNKGDGVEMRMNDYDGPLVEVVIRENIITNNEDDGIQLIDYDGYTPRIVRIEHNLIYANLQAGIGIMGNGDTHETYEGASALEAIFVTHNVIAGNDHGVTGGDNLTAQNNVFADHTNIAVKNIDGGSSVAYNLFWNNGTDIQASNVNVASSLFQDPLLDGNYHPLAGSPVIDAGADAGFPFKGLAPDLGAFETPVNSAPVVAAGADQTITWPTDTVALAGSASDDALPAAPGILDVTWVQTAGACGVVFGDATAAVTTATFPQPGIYLLELAASDGELNDTDRLMVEVLPEPPPTDSDGDGVNDNLDNCPDDPNTDQLNTDGDTLGDVCDDDDDNDGLSDTLELTVLNTDPLAADSDGDTLSDFYEVNIDTQPDNYTPGVDLNPLLADTDTDGLRDDVDPIPLTFNYADGDIAPLGLPDGQANAGDLVVCLRIVLGLLPVTEEALAHLDLAPAAAPDGVISLVDLLALQLLVLQPGP